MNCKNSSVKRLIPTSLKHTCVRSTMKIALNCNEHLIYGMHINRNAWNDLEMYTYHICKHDNHLKEFDTQLQFGE